MWSKIREIFKRKTTRPDDGGPSFEKTVLDELRRLKKALHKQELFLEAFRREVAGRFYERELQDRQPLFQLADAFFYLDTAVREMPAVSPEQLEALDMVWHYLETLLASMQVEVIRRTGASFDPRIHEAVERTAEAGGSPDLLVWKVVQPGYLVKGHVVKAAKTIVA